MILTGKLSICIIGLYVEISSYVWIVLLIIYRLTTWRYLTFDLTYLYFQTNVTQWYDPAAVTTVGGALQLTLDRKDTHDLKYEGGMMTSWNKLVSSPTFAKPSLTGTPLGSALPAALSKARSCFLDLTTFKDVSNMIDYCVTLSHASIFSVACRLDDGQPWSSWIRC